MKKVTVKRTKQPETAKRDIPPVETQLNLSPAIPRPDEPDVGARVATFLADRQGQVISAFSAAVHHDSKVQTSETLNQKQLTKHLPELLDQLADTLCNDLSREVKEQAAYVAATHGHDRWKKGYDLSELLRELGLLRSELIRQLVAFWDAHPDVGGAGKVFVITTVHRFLDDSMRVSVEQFVAAQERAQLNGKSPEPAVSPTGAGL